MSSATSALRSRELSVDSATSALRFRELSADTAPVEHVSGPVFGRIDASIGVIDGSIGAIEASIGAVDGMIGVIDETIGVIDETIGAVDGTIGVINGSIDAINTFIARAAGAGAGTGDERGDSRPQRSALVVRASAAAAGHGVRIRKSTSAASARTYFRTIRSRSSRRIVTWRQVGREAEQSTQPPVAASRADSRAALSTGGTPTCRPR